jgi:hypothetical protein
MKRHLILWLILAAFVLLVALASVSGETQIQRTNVVEALEDSLDDFGKWTQIEWSDGTGPTTTAPVGGPGTVGLVELDTDLSDIVGYVLGSYLDPPAVTVTSDGATITLSVEKIGGGDIRVVLSSGVYVWDTSPPDTVTLTAGSDSSPQLNYVYILETTKALTTSTVGFPAVAEFAPIATVLCQSAASLQTDAAYKVHAWTDDVKGINNDGHVGHVNSWIRAQYATWVSGVAPTLNITTNGGAADNVIYTTSTGVVLQLHKHIFPAFTGTPDMYVVNDSVTPYNIITDLNELLLDSTGASMSARRFNLVIWGAINEVTSESKLFINLPGGTYNSDTGVLQDADHFADFNIPPEFTGTGFLITELQLRHQTLSSGTWTLVGQVDLRGLFPAIQAGSGSGGATEFADNVFRIFDETDATKLAAFQASGITTATTRTYTLPDADGSIFLDESASLKLDSVSGGCIMMRDTDDAGWTEIFTLNGAITGTVDADGICDGI